MQVSRRGRTKNQQVTRQDDFLDTLLPLIEDLWRSPAQDAAEMGQGYLEPCVAVCANAGRSFYMEPRHWTSSR